MTKIKNQIKANKEKLAKIKNIMKTSMIKLYYKTHMLIIKQHEDRWR